MALGEFSDRLFDLRVGSQVQSSALWEGHAASYGNFENVVEYAIISGYVKTPGPYGIIRLDRTVEETNRPVLAYVCTVQDDMTTIVEGIEINPVQPQKKLVTWPPK